MSQKIIPYPGALDEVEGKLIQVGNRCGDCGRTSFPATERCPFCASANTERVPLSQEGTVYEFSVTSVPVPPYKPPFIGAYVDLPEGTRIFAQIHAGIDQVRVGMKVRVQTGVLWTEKDGTEIIGYYYIPCEEGNGGAQS